MEEVQRNLEKIFRYFLSSYKISRITKKKKKKSQEKSNVQTFPGRESQREGEKNRAAGRKGQERRRLSSSVSRKSSSKMQRSPASCVIATSPY